MFSLKILGGKEAHARRLTAVPCAGLFTNSFPFMCNSIRLYFRFVGLTIWVLLYSLAHLFVCFHLFSQKRTYFRGRHRKYSQEEEAR